MDIRAVAKDPSYDTAKLALAALLLIVGIWGFYLFAGLSLLLRVILLLIIAAGSAATVLMTESGRKLWRFGSDARMEVRKVVWPSRQETMQTTLVVIVMVLLLGLVLWLFDTVLMTIVRFLTGQGG